MTIVITFHTSLENDREKVNFLETSRFISINPLDRNKTTFDLAFVPVSFSKGKKKKAAETLSSLYRETWTLGTVHSNSCSHPAASRLRDLELIT